MRKFKSLSPADLPAAFDAEIHGEEPIVEVTESKERVVISYTFPGFYLSDDARDVAGEKVPFVQLNIAAAGFLAKSGKPLMPSFGRYVQIPANCSYTVMVEKAQAVQFDNVLVLPAQEQVTDSPNQQFVFEYDQDFYAADAWYPEELVEVSGPFVVDDYTVLLVHVSPLQYNPAKKQVVGYSNITVTIDVTPRDSVADQPDAGAELNREAFGNLLLNPRRGVAARLEVAAAAAPPSPFLLQGPEFLIIYDDLFKAAAEKLAKWKTRRGLRTETVSITGIGNSVGQIKAYIRGRRAGQTRLRYVLLFGDVDRIASETILGGAFGSNITDYYYSTDRDPAGTELVMPWLSVGRIPVRTAAEGMGVVNKLIAYERNPPASPDYYQRMIFAGYFQDGDGDAKDDRAYVQTLESIHSHMTALGFQVERVYVSTAGAPTPQFYLDGTPIPAEVVAAIMTEAAATNRLIAATTEGQLIAGHRDHGLEAGWHEPAFQKNHLTGVTGKMPTIFFSVNCLTGQFDLAGPTESFAENLLRMQGAAPSLVAATRVSHTWLNNDLIKGLFDATWGGVLPTFPGATASYPVRQNRLGDILNYGKAYLPVTMSGSTEYIKDHFEIYHIVGDPTLEVWRAKPLRVAIKAWVEGSDLHIQLDRALNDSVLTIWAGEGMLKRIEPSSTYMKLALPWEALQQKLSVRYWAPGCRFREVRPKIVST